jgi:hypothetical protein
MILYLLIPVSEIQMLEEVAEEYLAEPTNTSRKKLYICSSV